MLFYSSPTPPRVWPGASHLPFHTFDIETGWPTWTGPVAPHFDRWGEGLLWGLVMRSDGHVLHSDSLGDESLPLNVGDLYCIDGFDAHWTTCPTAESRIIVTHHFLPAEESDRAKIVRGLESDFFATLRRFGR